MAPISRAVRVLRAAAALVALAALGACGGVAPTGFSGDVDQLLARGDAYARRIIREEPARLLDEDVIALGYLERARLGLGSPFRLVDYALRDPDLPLDKREMVGYAILGMALNGRTYQVDPAVLDATRFSGAPPWLRAGGAQVELITRTVLSSANVTSGERAVRLGYTLAEAERTIENVPSGAVVQVSALVADRRRAADDARLLLRNAAVSGEDPLALLQEWRRQRRFQVERPALVPTSVREEEAIARGAPNVAQALEALGLRVASRAGAARPRDARDTAEPPFLTGEAAARLLELADRRNYPAQAPIAVAVMINRDRLLSAPDLDEDQQAARTAFADVASNEERLVAGAAYLHGVGAADVRVRRLLIQAAAFLRAWGQEEPWFPGDPVPSTRDVVARFGLAGIDFHSEVPDAWRPYYVRTLARALADLQRVLPSVSVRGLRVHFGPIPAAGRSLALHEPATRTLYLPPSSGAGTIAHEIAHDLDWQLARRRYDTRGGYATDLAVRWGRGDRIETSLRGLSAAFRRPGIDSIIDPHNSRPAEVFARGADWFVAAALAREGRTGVYLSSFQDPALTGYGSTRGPDISGGAVPALLGILDGIAPVPEETRDWALTHLGPGRSLTPTELATAILRAGQELPPENRLAAIAEARDRSLAAVNNSACRLSSTQGVRQLAAAQHDLIRASTAAAVRGAAIDEIRQLAGARLGEADPRLRQWFAWRFSTGAPEPTDSALVELAPAFEDMLHRANLIAREEPAPVGTPFRPAAPAVLCGGNPFAAAMNRGEERLFGGAASGVSPTAPSLYRF